MLDLAGALIKLSLRGSILTERAHGPDRTSRLASDLPLFCSEALPKLTDRQQRQVVGVERVLHVRVEVLRDAVVVAAEVDRRFAPGILDPGGTSHT